MNNYLLLQTAIGDYRQSTITNLENSMGSSLEIACGEIYFDNTTKTRVVFQDNRMVINNYFFLNRKVLFQYGANLKALKADNVILELNPRIINTWFIAVIRRLSAKPVVMWGHAWPRNGRGAKSDKLRHRLRKLATHLIVYTELQKKELLEDFPDLNIIVAPNSLYSAKGMAFNSQSPRSDFIYVGRLVESKKLSLLVLAFADYIERFKNTESKLIIVGEGPELENINIIISDNPSLKDRVELKGHVADPKKLESFYVSAVASVSPGYVGLSITQSFAFGVPMVISTDENHSPEIEAAIDGFNSVFFETDIKESLADKMNEMFIQCGELHLKGEKIVEGCKQAYSSELMAKRLEMALRLEPEYSPDNRKGYLSRVLRKAVRLVRRYKVKFKLSDRFVSGSNCYWGVGATIQSPEFFKLKNNFSAGANFFVQTNVKAESDCLISSNVSFVGDDHYLENEFSSHYWSGKKPPSTVVLEGNNFIGYGATIVGNVCIGRNSIVGAKSLVLNDVPPNCVVAGVPAKVIRKINSSDGAS
ncbi:MAG: hypothetical protein ISEC1_P0781 [Thiomicrorhabdus sp.]|nr:MAG: hypothetical protein ISEC1_P0781 [Thiomicrorhabdus sp.]